MTDFLTYDAKVAAALLAFYLCYRFPLKKETFHRFNRDDICVVRINSLDRVFFGNGAFDDADDILRLGKDFLRKHGARTRFSLGLDRGTSYAAFRRIQSLLTYKICATVRPPLSPAT